MSGGKRGGGGLLSQARLLAIAFIVVGALLAGASALADVLLGARGTVFGWKQLLGLVAGIALAVAGVLLLRQGDGEYGVDDEGCPGEGNAKVVDDEGRDARVATAVMSPAMWSAASGPDRRQRTVATADGLRDDTVDRA